jgi:cytochrome d ubiquinol oxidase subunit II
VDFAWWAVAALTVLLTLVTMTVQPQVARSLAARPWGYVFPMVALAGLVAVLWFSSHERDFAAFLASCTYIVGMLTSAAFGLYPYLLPSTTDPSRGLTVHASAAPAAGLRIGLAWWIPGMLLVVAYFVFTYRQFAGKVELQDEGY